MDIKYLNNYLKKCIENGICLSFAGLKNYKNILKEDKLNENMGND